MQSKGASVRKRAQIATANRTMFLWVAGVSIVLGFAVVGIIFLSQMLIFNEKVLIEKGKTISTLNANIKAVDVLKDSIKKLDANQALIDSKANADDQAIQVILDALPSEANSNAFGASLQNKLLSRIDGLTLDSLQVDPVVGVESLSSDGSTTIETGSSLNQITFTFSVSGSETALIQVLHNLEASIRTIEITSLKIESQGDIQTMTVKGVTFYEPAVIVELQDKVVKQ